MIPQEQSNTPIVLMRKAGKPAMQQGIKSEDQNQFLTDIKPQATDQHIDTSDDVQGIFKGDM